MQTFAMKRVTIVGENSFEERLVKELHELGATGYTYTVVHGEGARGARPSTWNGPNAEIEVIVTPAVADRILEHVAKNYFESHAIIAYADDVQVIRPEKFGG